MPAESAHIVNTSYPIPFSRTCEQSSDFFQRRAAAYTAQPLNVICIRTYDILWLSFVFF